MCFVDAPGNVASSGWSDRPVHIAQADFFPARNWLRMRRANKPPVFSGGADFRSSGVQNRMGRSSVPTLTLFKASHSATSELLQLLLHCSSSFDHSSSDWSETAPFSSAPTNKISRRISHSVDIGQFEIDDFRPLDVAQIRVPQVSLAEVCSFQIRVSRSAPCRSESCNVAYRRSAF